MIPGPDKVLACLVCDQAVRLSTLVSGNTIGGVVWTDGKADYPMLPVEPEIVRCRGCNRFFWLADATELGDLHWGAGVTEAVPEEWQSAPHVEELSESGYLEALSSGAARTEDDEVLLRVSAWWRGNDALRGRKDEQLPPTDGAPRPLSQAARSSLESLLGLLGSDPPGHVFMRAEILRELERYEEAAEALAVELPDELSGPAMFILRLIEDRNARVQQLPSQPSW